MDSRVKVPDLADTEGPVTESNCAGAISPGGEQLEVNEQSVTRLDTQRQVNSIRSAVLTSLLAKWRSPNKIVPPALREWNASEGEPQMVGDGMVGSSSDVNQGTTAGGTRAGRGQSPRSSEEAGNDRGAKGGRDVVLGAVKTSSQKGPGSAARLSARMRRKTGLEAPRRPDSGPPAKQVSGAQACAAGATHPRALSRVPEPVHREPRTGKPDALCGQLTYVVQRLKSLAFIGFLASPTPHNISRLNLVIGQPSSRLGRYVQKTVPLFPGDFAPCQRSVGR